jgi:hypothetical protein
VSTALIEKAQLAARMIQPLSDNRWDEFVRSRQGSSVFHTRGWLETLNRTYQYEPVVFTSSPEASRIRDGALFCRVSSRLTGKRLVSLPFSDHCDPLLDDSSSLEPLFAALKLELEEEKLGYIEMRPRHPLNVKTPLLHSEYSYCLHQLDLRPQLSTLFNKCHKDSTQRKIRRAEREGLRYEEGRSISHLNAFYRLHLLARKRHQVPPHPRRWFQNMLECMGDALSIRLAFKNGEPAAAILTLEHKYTLTYKYACSDIRFHALGPMHYLIWRAIQDAKQKGLINLDFGRSAWGNPGLITFKDRWGSTRSTLTYSRYGISKLRFEYMRDGTWMERTVKRAIGYLPDRIFQAVGEIFYKHIG